MTKLADELWEKYKMRFDMGANIEYFMPDYVFKHCLTQTMQAVRRRDAEVCRERSREWETSPPLTVGEPSARDCAAAIEREPLP